MVFQTNRELAGELRKLDELLGDEYEPLPTVSDHFALEVYDRYFEDVRKFLLLYAEILTNTGKPFTVDESDKLREQIDALEVAGNCSEVLLMAECTTLAYHLKQAIGEVACSPYSSAASIISAVSKKYKPFDFEMDNLDYDGNYDAYLTQKLEEYKQWQTNLH